MFVEKYSCLIKCMIENNNILNKFNQLMMISLSIFIIHSRYIVDVVSMYICVELYVWFGYTTYC